MRRREKRTLGNLVDVLVPGDELGRDGDAGRRLNLVAREHPNLDARVPEELNRHSNVVLELVFDARNAE